MSKRRNWLVGVPLALVCWIIITLVVGILAGCESRNNDYLAIRFSEFNDDVQAVLEDCLADPNACRPTLELMAAETAVWAEIWTDPNL